MSDILKIDNILGKTKNMIYRVGIELEGGWKKLPEGVRALVHDGSVHVELPVDEKLQERLNNLSYKINHATSEAAVRAYRKEYARLQEELGIALHVGELPSDILEPTKFPLWMKQSYPQVVNNSCGMHVHMSFMNALNYQRLMIKEYPQTMVAYVTEWAKEENLDKNHPIWPRLKGQSRYCQHKFAPDIQATKVRKEYDQQVEGNRYSVINYCFNANGTMECRLLPMMDTVEQGIRAVQRVLDITNAALVVAAKTYKEEKLVSEVTADGLVGRLQEERTEYV